MRGVGRIKHTRKNPAFARRGDCRKDRQVQFLQVSQRGWQVGCSSDLAGQTALAMALVTRFAIGAEVGQRCAIGKGKSKGLIGSRGQPMRKPRRNQCDGQRHQKQRPVHRMDGLAKHTQAMPQLAAAVNICPATSLRQNRPTLHPGTGRERLAFAPVPWSQPNA